MGFMDRIDPQFGGRCIIPHTSEDKAGAVTLTANASADTKGSYTEILAAASNVFTIGMIVIETGQTNVSGTDTGQLMDVAIGAASSEQVIIANIPTGWSALQDKPLCIPLIIPEGERVSARIQASTGSDTVDVLMSFYEVGAYRSYQHCQTIGADTTNSCGTTVETTSWVELDASIDDHVEALVPIFDFGSGGSFGGDSNEFDIGVGAASSEVQVYPPSSESFGLLMETGSQENISLVTYPASHVLPTQINIPAGTRVAMRRPNGGRDSGCVLLGLS